MALTGQLSDMSLAELIEFFCNQRKTGRLKIDYQRGHSVFFIKDGELVDAKVGTLSGAEAVYYSLTLPNAAFDFSPEVPSSRRTITEPWTQVVLEGLRRLDEGLSPSDADAFGNWSPSDADVAQMMDHVERLGESGSAKEAGQKSAPGDPADAPLSFMVEGAAAGGGRKKGVMIGVAASVVLVCAVAAVPFMRRPSAPKPAENNAAASSAPAPTEQPAATSEPAAPAADPNAATPANAEAGDAAAEAARREREERERRERKRRAEEAARKEAETAAAKPAATPAPQPAGPKTVRVTVNYDENGRVTQASVAGASAGAEAYGGTAVRIARGKRFPAGKAGSTVVTIPVN